MNSSKFVILVLAVFFVADAVAITTEDSALLSSILAKLQQLESKVMISSHTRSVREATEEPIKAPTTVPQCNCPPGVVTYVRWGNSTCPHGADTIYSGVAAGSWYDHQGAAVDPLCLPYNPKYLHYQSGYQGGAYLYGAEYQVHGSLDHSNNHNIPCAVCQAYSRTTSLMIPSQYECPPGWTREYYGYLMAGHYDHKAATQHICMDKGLEQIPGSGGDTDGKLFYRVEAQCNHFIPCSDKELTCVVCTK